MKIVILAQEEPVCFGPFFRRVITALGGEVVLIALAGGRGAGSHPKTFLDKLRNLYLLWLLLEPWGFFKSLGINLGHKILQITGLLGSFPDSRSLEGLARRLKIQMLKIALPDSPELLARLREIEPDLIINQTELLLKEPLLSLPKVGVLNRHGSLLPHFRGRLASFRAHCQEPPEYGLTIHFVNENIDAGGIVAQKSLDISPTSSYLTVLEEIFRASAPLLLEAIEKLQNPNFEPQANLWQGTPVYKFPTLGEVQNYRKVLRKRRGPHSPVD